MIVFLSFQGRKICNKKGGTSIRVVTVNWKHGEHYSLPFCRMGEIGPSKKVYLNFNTPYDTFSLVEVLVKGYSTDANKAIFEDSLVELGDPRSTGDEFIEKFIDKDGKKCDYWKFQEFFLPRDAGRRLKLLLFSTRMHDVDKPTTDPESSGCVRSAKCLPVDHENDHYKVDGSAARPGKTISPELKYSRRQLAPFMTDSKKASVILKIRNPLNLGGLRWSAETRKYLQRISTPKSVFTQTRPAPFRTPQPVSVVVIHVNFKSVPLEAR